jgi:hypothetical protein
MANTFIQIGSTLTAGAGGAASFDFTSIPNTYTDLLVVCSLRSTNTNLDTKINFNSVTTGYSRRTLQGNGSGTPGSFSGSDAYIGDIVSSAHTANTFSNHAIYIPNYAGSTNKSWSLDGVDENNATNAFSILGAGLWSNTAAITTVSIAPITSFNFAQYSTASLYGISKS